MALRNIHSMRNLLVLDFVVWSCVFRSGRAMTPRSLVIETVRARPPCSVALAPLLRAWQLSGLTFFFLRNVGSVSQENICLNDMDARLFGLHSCCHVHAAQTLYIRSPSS